MGSMVDKTFLVLCADDFGLSESVDRAILDLVARGRLSAVSCMVGGPSLTATARDLGRSDGVHVGLHLTLTTLPPLGPLPELARDGRAPALGGLIARSLCGMLDYAEIKAEVGRQIARFGEIFGRAPDFVDGHQHVHVLPTVRRALLSHVAEGRLPAGRFWIRSCEEPWPEIRRRGVEVRKAAFIAALSKGLAAEAQRAGAAANDSFRGVTNFRADPPFRSAFRAFLTGPGARPLVMCHPGLSGFAPDPTDPIAEARMREYAYLSSDAFAEDLDAAGVRIAPFPSSGGQSPETNRTSEARASASAAR